MSEHTAESADGAARPGVSQAIHATALVVGEAGVIIRGSSGAGKSSLAIALLALARDRRLFAQLIGDDRLFVHTKAGKILARGAPRVRGLIERRGYGIVEAATEPGAIIRLIVDLLAQSERTARLPDDDVLKTSLGGVALPRLVFGAESNVFERAYAVLGYLDNIGDRIMTAFAHFT